MDKVVKIREINPHIVCSLCAGYFIDATTITECLHTFCRRCIVKYLQLSKYCPTCNLKIHETQPLLNVRLDRTMQDIVFKVVPNLFEDEEAKEHAFYEERGMPVPKKETEECDSEEESQSSMRNDVTENINSFKDDELISICLKPHGSSENSANPLKPVFGSGHPNTEIFPPKQFLSSEVLSRKYLRCSHRILVLHLAKLLRKKLNLSQDKQVEFLCEDQPVNPSCSMKLIYVVYWARKGLPMCLHYRVYSSKSLEEITTAEENLSTAEDTWL